MINKTAKTAVGVLAAASVIPAVLGASANAATGVKLDEKTFPDVNLRTYIMQFDFNNNGALDSDEIKLATDLDLPSTILNLKGIEKLSNARIIRMNDNTFIDSMNFKGNSKLEYLSITKCKIKSIDLSKNKNLCKVVLRGNDYLKNVNLHSL